MSGSKQSVQTKLGMIISLAIAPPILFFIFVGLFNVRLSHNHSYLFALGIAAMSAAIVNVFSAAVSSSRDYSAGWNLVMASGWFILGTILFAGAASMS